MASEDEISTTINKLMADLEIEWDPSSAAADNRETASPLTPQFATILDMQPVQFGRIALDVAVFVGLAGDWVLSLKIASRLIELNDDRLVIKLWQLRCLVELSRYVEAVALSSTLRWPPDSMIHVNYLTATALEALGMREQAQVRYRAVYDAGSTYRDVALRLMSR